MAKKLSSKLLWHVFCLIFVQSLVLALVHILFVIKVSAFLMQRRKMLLNAVYVF